jgi:hypothetical protein
MRYPATGEGRYPSTAGVTRLQGRLHRVARIKQFVVAVLREFGPPQDQHALAHRPDLACLIGQNDLRVLPTR